MREIKIKYYFKNQVNEKEIINYIFEDIDNMYIGDFIYELNLDGGDFEVIDRCLYTGMKDKNGKEIYEGDVVRFADKYIYEIIFNKCKFSKKSKYGEFDLYDDEEDIEGYKHYDLEIIGNIYENPEPI